MNGIAVDCIPFDVSRQSLSIHQPLWRFISGLFNAPAEILRHYIVDKNLPGPTIDPSWLDQTAPINLKGLRKILMEMPLRYTKFIY